MHVKSLELRGSSPKKPRHDGGLGSRGHYLQSKPMGTTLVDQKVALFHRTGILRHLCHLGLNKSNFWASTQTLVVCLPSSRDRCQNGTVCIVTIGLGLDDIPCSSHSRNTPENMRPWESSRPFLKRSDLVIRKGTSFTWVVPKIVFGLLG